MAAGHNHPAEDFMARQHRLEGLAPFIAHGVQVGMAGAAVLDLDLHVMRAGVAPLEVEVVQRIVGARSAVTFGLKHSYAFIAN